MSVSDDQPRYHRALAELASDPVLASDATLAFQRICQIAAEALRCDSTNLWLLSANGDTLTCVAAAGSDTSGRSDLRRSDLPVYFAALHDERVIAASEARSDPRTKELIHNYLDPLGVAALLDSPIRHRQKLIGMLCAEQHRPRSWNHDEISFLGSLADFASIAHMAREHQQIEHRLRDEQKRLDLILGHADAVIFRFDPQGRISYVSPRVHLFTDIPREQQLGTSWDQIAHPDDLRQLFRAAKALHEGKQERVRNEFRVLPPDGSTRWVSATSTLMVDENNEKSIVAVIHDITAEKQKEEEHQRLQLRLQESQRLEAIGRLAGGIAHDFNNLLTVILGGTDLALMQIQDERNRNLLHNIHSAANRAARLTQQLLAYSRRQVLDMRHLRIDEVIDELRHLLRSAVRENIELSIQIEPGLPTIRGDRQQIAQIILTLASRASTVMGEGGQFEIVARAFSVHQEGQGLVPAAPPGQYLLIELKDNGEAMDSATREHLFEPFFGALADRSDEPSRDGLSLAAVFGIVTQHNGFIEVTSHPGQGTAFHVLLPATSSPVAEVAAPAYQPIVHAKRVLVVEDDPSVRTLTSLILKQQGLQTDEASDVNDAMRRVRECKGDIDLLIVDVVMPGMTGVELHQQLKREFPHLRALYISGYAEDALRDLPFAESVVHYLQKPFTLSSLQAKVSAILGSTENT